MEAVILFALVREPICEARALENSENEQCAFTETNCVYVFELDGDYWRLTADITPAQSEAIFALDMSADDYDAKYDELVNPLAVTNCENLRGQILSDDALAALTGKTGGELLDDGWTTGYGYNLDEMAFYMDYGPFSYVVTFESDQQLENTDDFDEEAAIRDLPVKSAAFFGLGDSATDLPEENAQ